MKTATQKKPTRKPKADALERLDMRPFVELVRDLRTAQLACPEDRGETRRITNLLDPWLVELGYPPVLPGVVLLRYEVDE